MSALLLAKKNEAKAGTGPGPGLRVSEPADSFEREADLVADEVMSGRNGTRHWNLSGIGIFGGIQRKCGCGGSGECEECKKKAAVQRKAFGEAQSPDAESLVSGVLRSGGRPLDGEARAFFEPRFGRDFSKVRVHDGPQAAASAQAISALAYTSGPNIVFGARQYSGGVEGRRLLAHELAHTVQQSGGGSPHSGPVVARKESPKGKIAADPIQEINIDPTQKTVEMKTASGFVVTGSVDTDLPPGEYWGRPDPKHQKWIIEGIQGGLRFWVELNPLDDSGAPGPDPWALHYAPRISIVVGGGTNAGGPELPSLDVRIKNIREHLETVWVGGGDAELIIGLILDTPSEQAAELIKRLGEEKVNDRTFLDEMDHRLDGENNQKLHEALSQLRLKAMGPEAGLPGLTGAPVLPWHDVMGFFETNATFEVEKTEKGKYRLHYLGGTRLLDSNDFSAEIRKLPQDLFVGGLDFEPGSVIIVHDYDSGHFVPLVVDELAGYQHAGIRKFLGDVGTVASLAAPVSAAKTIAGKVAVYTLERVLPAMILLADENRLNLVKWFPKWGPRMLRFTDTAKVALGVYGLGRFALSSAQFFRNWKQVRNMRELLDGATTSRAAEALAAQMEKQADEIISEAEKLQKAESGAAKGAEAGKGAEGGKTAAAADTGAPAQLKAAEDGVPAAKAPENVPQQAQAAPNAATQPAGRPAKIDSLEGVTDETKRFLQAEANKPLKEALDSSPLAAKVLKRCLSPCYPEFASPAQIARIERMLEDAENAGFPINYKRLTEQFRSPSVKTAADLDKEINYVGKLLEEKKAIAVVRASHDQLAPPGEHYDMTPLASQLRRQPGVASGGEALKVQGRDWIQGGKGGLFPKQIAEKMRGMHFSNFDEFRATFWKLVASDEELASSITRQGNFTPATIKSNLALMKQGKAPYAVVAEQTGTGRANMVWNLDHTHDLQAGGAVYDMDSLQVRTPDFHEKAGKQ